MSTTDQQVEPKRGVIIVSTEPTSDELLEILTEIRDLKTKSGWGTILLEYKAYDLVKTTTQVSRLLEPKRSQTGL